MEIPILLLQKTIFLPKESKILNFFITGCQMDKKDIDRKWKLKVGYQNSYLWILVVRSFFLGINPFLVLLNVHHIRKV